MGEERKDTPGRLIRIPTPIWDAYEEVCKQLDTNRTEDVLAHIRRQINRHGNERHINMLVEGEQELAERRARMHPGRPRKQPPTAD